MSAGCGGVSQKVVLALKETKRAGLPRRDQGRGLVETHWVASGALGSGRLADSVGDDVCTHAIRKQAPRGPFTKIVTKPCHRAS